MRNGSSATGDVVPPRLRLARYRSAHLTIETVRDCEPVAKRLPDTATAPAPTDMAQVLCGNGAQTHYRPARPDSHRQRRAERAALRRHLLRQGPDVRGPRSHQRVGAAARHEKAHRILTEKVRELDAPGDSFAQRRMYSKYLALRIKAAEVGLAPAQFRARARAGRSGWCGAHLAPAEPGQSHSDDTEAGCDLEQLPMREADQVTARQR